MPPIRQPGLCSVKQHAPSITSAKSGKHCRTRWWRCRPTGGLRL